MIGRTLGRYKITAKLGEGGMGSVWLAEDTLLGRALALKLLAGHLADSEAARQRFIREARAASRLEHAGIATVYDAGEAQGQVFIAYQFVEGETLAKRLTAGPLALPQLLALARGTAEALAHAHARDVLHRDLTAGNVMLRPDGSPVIVDFGLARTQGDVTLTSTGITLGTAPYLAPEQWRGEPGDARTDLWSLGVVLYYAATGMQPFGSDAPEAVMYRVLNDEPVKPSKLRAELPEEFERLVLRLLEKDARDRLASAEELASTLKAVAGPEVEAEDTPVNNDTPIAQVQRWWRRQARRKFEPAQVVAALSMLLAVGAGSWLLYQRFMPHPERVLAVMPMRNTSRDADETAHLGEALGEELARRIGASGALRILPWSTTVAFAGKTLAPKRLAHDLQADLLLQGSYHSDGETIEVMAELVDGRTGLQVWSERYTRPTGELINLQSELAIAVTQRAAQSLDAVKLERITSSAAKNPEAYENYIRGANYLNAPDEATQALAEPFFQKAVQLDSTLAVAWVGLGAIRATSYFSGGPGGLANLTEAESYFRRALAIEPDLPQAERGLIRVAGDAENIDVVLELAAGALRRDPDAVESQLTAGWGLTLGGLPELAVPMFDRALESDPNNQGAAWYRVVALCWAGEYAGCIESGKKYVQRYGEDAELYTHLGLSSAALGHRDNAVTYLERAVELNQSGRYAAVYLAGWYRTLGETRKLQALVDSTAGKLLAIVEASPDNLRMRCEYAALLAEAGDSTRASAQLTVIVGQLRRGSTATGEEEQDLIFALVQAGNLRLARDLVVATSALPAIWWVGWRLFEDGTCYVGGASTAFRQLAEYSDMRARVFADHARKLAIYGPIVDRLRARWTRAPKSSRAQVAS